MQVCCGCAIFHCAWFTHQCLWLCILCVDAWNSEEFCKLAKLVWLLRHQIFFAEAWLSSVCLLCICHSIFFLFFFNRTCIVLWSPLCFCRVMHFKWLYKTLSLIINVCLSVFVLREDCNEQMYCISTNGWLFYLKQCVHSISEGLLGSSDERDNKSKTSISL